MSKEALDKTEVLPSDEDEEEEEDLNISYNPKEIKSFFKDDNDEYNFESRKPVQLGRKNKNYTINSTLLNSEYNNLRLQQDASGYNKAFVDMIINGNFRIKYIPALANRETAEQYCQKKLNPDGQPIYRVLPPNAKDAYGNLITDLNGDFIDEIVIVNRSGVPVIVNGYQLVKADPYKKIWKAKFHSKTSRKNNPFNKWLAEEFGKTTANIDWENAKYNITNESRTDEMKYAMKLYGDQGLPKPKISKSFNPKGVFARKFGEVWRNFWNQESLKTNKVIKKFVPYINFSSLMYFLFVDRNIINERQTIIKTYKQFIEWKKNYKEAYNKMAAKNLQKFVNASDKVIFKNIANVFTYIIPNIKNGGDYNSFEEMLEDYNVEWEANNLYTDVIKNLKATVVENINAYVESAAEGYIRYKNEYKKARQTRRDNAKSYDILLKEGKDGQPIYREPPKYDSDDDY